MEDNFRYFGPAPEGLWARLHVNGFDQDFPIVALMFNIEDGMFDGLMFVAGEMYPARRDENFREFILHGKVWNPKAERPKGGVVVSNRLTP